MNSTTIPGFVAERSLCGSTSRRVSVGDVTYNLATESKVVNGPDQVSPAEEPGGPGNVPAGYERDCKRVAFTICAGNRCWTEYYWDCTYYPLPTRQ